MARWRYFLDSTNKLVGLSGYIGDDPPTGGSAVDIDTIGSAYTAGPILLGGTWDGTTYTPPTETALHPCCYSYDVTTDKGKLFTAVSEFMEYILIMYESLIDEGRGHTTSTRFLVEDLLLGAEKACYIYMKDDTKTVDKRVLWAQNMTKGPNDATSIFDFFKAVEGLTIPDNFVQGKEIAWANIANTSCNRRKIQVAVNKQATDFATATDFSNVKLRSKEWIYEFLS